MSIPYNGTGWIFVQPVPFLLPFIFGERCHDIAGIVPHHLFEHLVAPAYSYLVPVEVLLVLFFGMDIRGGKNGKKNEK